MLHFHSLHDFLAMGGYARYVWSAFGLTGIVLAWNSVYPWLCHRRLLMQLRKNHASHS